MLTGDWGTKFWFFGTNSSLLRSKVVKKCGFLRSTLGSTTNSVKVGKQTKKTAFLVVQKLKKNKKN